MRQHCPRRSAFTLIELLVVIAIIALLVTFLIPYLTSAREIGKRVVCMQYQKNIAQAIMQFANMHSGRGPGGGGFGPDPATIYSGMGWTSVLNTEWYRARTICMGMWPPIPKNQLLCPNAKIYGGRLYTCPYQYAQDCDGFTSTGVPTYALVLDPNTAGLRSLYPTGGNGPLVKYHLGAKLELFKRADVAYMVIESEHANGTIGDPDWTGWYTPIVNGDKNPSLPPWGASSGPQSAFDFYGFRHCLPQDRTLYQKMATACFSFVDGHVSVVQPTADLGRPERFYLNGVNHSPTTAN